MFHIFTDLAANLPEELVAQYNLDIIPLICELDGQPVDVSQGFDGKDFYDRMRAGAMTKTAMPPLGLFLDKFREVLERGEDILYIGMSSGISGTIGLAKTVARELEEEFPERTVAVVDTRAASLGEGLHVIRAAQMRAEGATLEEARASAEEGSDHIWQVFTVEDLEYLRRGGRLYSVTAKVGNLLNVKPILMGDDHGRIVVRHMNVGRRRSLDTLVSKYAENCPDKSQPVGLAHADTEKDMEYVVDKLRKAGCTGQIYTVLYEPVTGSHVGPGTVALFFYGTHR
jgi:DegV family protein with EDD domain